jgi:hypothetical protein
MLPRYTFDPNRNLPKLMQSYVDFVCFLAAGLA